MRVGTVFLASVVCGAGAADAGKYKRSSERGRLSLEEAAVHQVPGTGPDWYTEESFLETSSQVERGLELLEQLKENIDDEAAQQEYQKLIGEVEWASDEDRDAMHPSRSAFVEEEPETEGVTGFSGLDAPMAQGTDLHFSERVGHGGLTGILARWLTYRRDYGVEAGGERTPKFFLDGETWSLHNRMYLYVEGEHEPRYVIRRAYNYLNPVARTVGQQTYRIVPFASERNGGYAPKDSTFTVTKDRFGRGGLWLHEEWRVYLGDGGCSRWSFGVLNCDQGKQVYYSISEGLSKASWETTFYKGNILSMAGDHRSARVAGKGTIEMAELIKDYQVAHAKKVGGVPRKVRWLGQFMTVVVSTFAPVVSAANVAAAWLWADSYEVTLDQETDGMLMSAIAAMQDIQRDRWGSATR
mmetsp:Transcript_10966/g.24185  ORF Transcript_10966/g.24185 Transcript_10966/m.24185 type:complete len:412 (-) Transcript_10966:46-1281(-)